MIIEGLHEKEIFTEQYPFRLIINTIEEFQYPLHWHNAVELVYNIAGTCHISVAGTDRMLAGNDILFIPPGEIHEITESGRNGKRCFIQFSITALDGFGGVDNILPFMENTLVICSDTEPEFHCSVEKCITELIREYEEKEYAYTLSLSARIFDILVLIARRYANRAIPSGMSDGNKKITGLKLINKAFKYIEKNYSSNITLKDVSVAVGFSEYYFSRLFKEYTGQNFQKYLSGYRIKQAEKLLRHSELPILAIALETGFNSLTTFNRIFKKVRGCSPTVYRKSRL